MLHTRLYVVTTEGTVSFHILSYCQLWGRAYHLGSSVRWALELEKRYEE